jgi:NAD+ synthase
MTEQSELTEIALEIDSGKWSSIIEEFIRTKFAESRKAGIVVPVSGGLDSSVVATLCTRAIGKERVTGLMLPERWGNPEANRYGKLIINHLGIKSKTIFINPTIRSLGISSILVTLLGGRESWRKRIENFKVRTGDEIHSGYLKMLRGEYVDTFQKYTSRITGRQRARLLYACKYAEDNNLLLAGAAHKTERAVGLFAKFGIDDSADIMPLKTVYRSQIVQIGRYIGVPEQILGRSPNPDMIPGVTDKYLSYIELSALQVDLILYGLEMNMNIDDIAEQLEINKIKIQEIQEIYKLTEQQRNASLAPILEFE